MSDMEKKIEEGFKKWRADLKNPVSHCSRCGSVDIDDLKAWSAACEWMRQEMEKEIKELRPEFEKMKEKAWMYDQLCK